MASKKKFTPEIAALLYQPLGDKAGVRVDVKKVDSAIVNKGFDEIDSKIKLEKVKEL